MVVWRNSSVLVLINKFTLRLLYFTGRRTVVFTALHEMLTRSSDENSVCPSVRLPVYQTRAL